MSAIDGMALLRLLDIFGQVSFGIVNRYYIAHNLNYNKLTKFGYV